MAKIQNLSAITTQVTQHRKQISIESRVEQVISTKDSEAEDGQEESPYATLNRMNSMSKVSVVISSDGKADGNLDDEVRASDPANWSTTKKALSYTSLLLLAAITASLKLPLTPLTAVLAIQFQKSYFTANFLTGIPILVGAFSSLLSAVLSRVVGKRVLLLLGAGAMIVGACWNLLVRNVYAELMAARIFQGVGWGVVEGVLAESVSGLFAANRQSFHQCVFMGVNVCFTWAAPIWSAHLAGKTSSSQISFRKIFLPVVIAQAVSFLLLILFTPETSSTQHHLSTSTSSKHLDETTQSNTAAEAEFEKDKKIEIGTLQTTITSTSNNFRGQSKSGSFLESLRCPRPPSQQVYQEKRMWKPLKALLAPSTILRTLLVAPLGAAASGIGTSLALLFGNLEVRGVGEMFILPTALALSVTFIAITSSLFSASRRTTSKLRAFKLQHRAPDESGRQGGKRVKGALILLSILSGGFGILLFGCYVCKRFGIQIWDFAQVDHAAASATQKGVMKSGIEGVLGMESVKMWWIVSLLFAMPVFASTSLTFVASRSSVNLSLSNRESTEREVEVELLIQAATRFYTHLLEGVFVLFFPVWIGDGVADGDGLGTKGGLEVVTGLRTLTIAIPIAVGMLSGAAGIGLVFGGAGLKMKDAKILGVEGKGEEEKFDKEEV